ncbi:MAG: hypothetical protein AAB737_04670 [Patescibacteria group bacterium]
MKRTSEPSISTNVRGLDACGAPVCAVSMGGASVGSDVETASSGDGVVVAAPLQALRLISRRETQNWFSVFM